MYLTKQLHKARVNKYDEFYTTYEDIENEIETYYRYDENVFKDKTILLPCDDPEKSNFTRYFITNFKRFGLKKLISTCYSNEVKNLTLFDITNPEFNREKYNSHGKVLIVDESNIDNISLSNLCFTRLNGDGDFRSKEITQLRDEADIVITNPPFSLFRVFMRWILDGNKKLIVMGPINSVTTFETFELIRSGKLWLGKEKIGLTFECPIDKGKNDNNKLKIEKINNVVWYTNLEYGKKYKEIKLYTMEENLTKNKKLQKKLQKLYDVNYYPKLDNYEAIEVPDCEAVPIDYDGVMAVPITFLRYLDLSQYELIGHTHAHDKNTEIENLRTDNIYRHHGYINGKMLYDRLLIRKTT